MNKIWMTQEEFERITGGIKMKRDYPIKDVSCDEDVITNLAWENSKMEEEISQLKGLMKQFFAFLDHTVTNDDGKEYHPLTIGCTRAMWVPRLEKLLAEMKEACEYKKEDI